MVLPLARFVTFTSASAQDARSSDSQPKPKQACSPGATGLGFRVNHRNLASLDSADAVVLLVPRYPCHRFRCRWPRYFVDGLRFTDFAERQRLRRPQSNRYVSKTHRVELQGMAYESALRRASSVDMASFGNGSDKTVRKNGGR